MGWCYGQAFHVSPRPFSYSPTNVFPTAITVLSVAGLVAGAAVGAALTHDIALPSQRCFAFEAAEVPHVPVPALGLGALRGEDDLRGEGKGIGTRATLAIRRAFPWPRSPSTPTPGWTGMNLVTGLATRAQALCVVAAAVDFAGMVEVDEVHQQLAARGAHETLWVPAGTQACSAGKHSDVATSDLLPALPDDRETLPLTVRPDGGLPRPVTLGPAPGQLL